MALNDEKKKMLTVELNLIDWIQQYEFLKADPLTNASALNVNKEPRWIGTLKIWREDFWSILNSYLQYE